jgi:putative membrane protein
MSTASVRDRARDHPGAITALLTVVGYGAVGGVFLVPEFQALFPTLTQGTVDLLAHAIAAVNTVTVITLSLGWYWIRNGEVKKHAAAMTTSFGLILLFLGMYLPKVAGGGTKEFVLDSSYAWVPLWEPVYPAYLLMLAIHIVLSVISVPVVLYAIVLGLTHTERELRNETPHRRVGRIAASAWILSLALGVVTYLLLNHLYDSTFAAAEAATVLLPAVPV